MMKRLLMGGLVAVVALSVVAYAFASGGENTSPGAGTDDMMQSDPPPSDGPIIDLPSGTPGNASDSPAQGGNAAGGTRLAGSGEDFGPAGEPITTTPDAPVSNIPSTPPDANPVTPLLPSGPTSPSGPAPALPADRHAEPAPIDGLDVRVAESFPPQYFLNIKAGLPSGCAERYTYSMSRAGDVISVTVLNSLPKDAMCTAIYGMYELNLNLGSGFDAGKTYTVHVNDKSLTFKGQ
jgi:hypothetical protein